MPKKRNSLCKYIIIVGKGKNDYTAFSIVIEIVAFSNAGKSIRPLKLTIDIIIKIAHLNSKKKHTENVKLSDSVNHKPEALTKRGGKTKTHTHSVLETAELNLKRPKNIYIHGKLLVLYNFSLLLQLCNYK